MSLFGGVQLRRNTDSYQPCRWAVGCARWRTVELPGGGQQSCPSEIAAIDVLSPCEGRKPTTELFR